MAIINCLSSPTMEIPAEFPTWCVLAKLNAKHTQLLIAETVMGKLNVLLSIHYSFICARLFA